ncbi:MAG: hypothetical protein ACI9EF_001811 [Pseudohongiellaceae bacterium]|jgi:hypothetical protein
MSCSCPWPGLVVFEVKSGAVLSMTPSQSDITALASYFSQ